MSLLSDSTNPAAVTQSRGAHQATVDGDALFGSVARGSGSLQPLGTGQVHKVELGGERLVLVHLGVPVGDPVVGLGLLLSENDTHDHWLDSLLYCVIGLIGRAYAHCRRHRRELGTGGW